MIFFFFLHSLDTVICFTILAQEIYCLLIQTLADIKLQSYHRRVRYDLPSFGTFFFFLSSVNLHYFLQGQQLGSTLSIKLISHIKNIKNAYHSFLHFLLSG